MHIKVQAIVNKTYLEAKKKYMLRDLVKSTKKQRETKKRKEHGLT